MHRWTHTCRLNSQGRKWRKCTTIENVKMKRVNFKLYDNVSGSFIVSLEKDYLFLLL